MILPTGLKSSDKSNEEDILDSSLLIGAKSEIAAVAMNMSEEGVSRSISSLIKLLDSASITLNALGR